MNEDTAGGKLDQITGKIKQGIGEAVGNEKLADKGAAEEVKGHAKETWGNVKDAAGKETESATAGSTGATGNLRDKVVAGAEHAKESISRALDPRDEKV